MKEIVVISGKGGTGKTSITASFAYLGGRDVVLADCDVDAADLHLLLKPDFAEAHDYYSGKLAHIDKAICIECGKCIEKCHFDAISLDYNINAINCEGCGYCQKLCPVNAISLSDCMVGKWYKSSTRIGNKLIHARLGIGADNSGKLVARVKKEARLMASLESAQYVIVDGSPGIGCPVVSSLSGADYVVLVTESTISGFHDLKRVYELVRNFKLKAACIINKYDLNIDITSEIESFLKEENIVHLSNIPYNENFTKSMTEGKTIVEYDNTILKNLIEDSWNKLKILTQ